MRTLTALLVIELVAGSAAALVGAPGYHLLKTIAIPGVGGWDYLTVDGASRRVYISHGTEVQVYGK